MSTAEPQKILTALETGKMKLHGEFMWGSNYTYLVQVEHNEEQIEAVYKPTKGVRPLWDFSSASLARREVAAYLVSKALGWSLVPPSVLRKDGPLGAGSVQLFIEHDPEYNYFSFSPEDRQRLRPTVLFDLLVNNADRKGSHVLVDPDRHFWLIDHGICFHVEEKLRTVIWDFAGEPIPEDLAVDLQRFSQMLEQNENLPQNEANPIVPRLTHYLSSAEVAALQRRLERLLADGCFPDPDPGRRQYPWPPV